MKLFLKHWVKKLPAYWDVYFTIHNVFFSLLKDEQHLSVNDIEPRDYKGDREGIPHIHPIP